MGEFFVMWEQQLILNDFSLIGSLFIGGSPEEIYLPPIFDLMSLLTLSTILSVLSIITFLV